jgi:Glutathione S-transferase, C-terminal domain
VNKRWRNKQLSPAATIKEAIGNCNLPLDLLPGDALLQVEINQWLEYSISLFMTETGISTLSQANERLLLKAYLVGNTLSIADAALLFFIEQSSHASLNEHTNIKRWVSLVQSKLSREETMSIARSSTIFFKALPAVSSQEPTMQVASFTGHCIRNKQLIRDLLLWDHTTLVNC